jgi:hypothetical protein
MLFQAFQLLDMIMIKNDKNTVEKHLFFLFKAYYFFIINPCCFNNKICLSISVVSHIRVMFSLKAYNIFLHFNLTYIKKFVLILYILFNIAFIIRQEL